jgi:hypothetical protein
VDAVEDVTLRDGYADSLADARLPPSPRAPASSY